MEMHQNAPRAQFQGRSGRQAAGCRRNNTTSGHGHGNANCNSHPRSELVTPLGTALTMAADRSAAAASHPPAGHPMSNFLPRVAGLSRRGQAPPPKVKQLKTPLARPVPNKKAAPRPQEAANLAVLGIANPSTSGSGESGQLGAHISLAYAQRRGEVHEPSLMYMSATSDNADDSHRHIKHHICGTKRSTGPDRKKDVSVSQVGFRHVEHVASVVRMPRVSARPQSMLIAHQHTTESGNFRDSKRTADPAKPAAAARAGPVGGVRRQFLASLHSKTSLQSMLSCLSSEGNATPSMASCLSLNGTATPSMKSCLSPTSLSAQSTHSMVTCLTTDGRPMEAQMTENDSENAWTSPMVEQLLVTAICSLPIPRQAQCGTQTEELPSTSARGPGLKIKKGTRTGTTRLVGGRAKSCRKLNAAPRVDDSEWGLFKTILVGAVQALLFIVLTWAVSVSDIQCL